MKRIRRNLSIVIVFSLFATSCATTEDEVVPEVPVPPGNNGNNDDGNFDGTVHQKEEDKQKVVTDFKIEEDRIDLGTQSIHNQIPIETEQGLKFDNLFNENYLLIEDVFLHQLKPLSFVPIADAHLQQDLSAILAWEDGSALVRENTIYIRSHEQGREETVDFNPATDHINFMYLSVRADANTFKVEQSSEGVRFYSPITGQSITLRNTTFNDIKSHHIEFRANQLEDGVVSYMGLDASIEWDRNEIKIYSGKSIANAGGEDRAPYHVHQHSAYTGIPRKDTPGFEN